MDKRGLLVSSIAGSAAAIGAAMLSAPAVASDCGDLNGEIYDCQNCSVPHYNFYLCNSSGYHITPNYSIPPCGCSPYSYPDFYAQGPCICGS